IEGSEVAVKSILSQTGAHSFRLRDVERSGGAESSLDRWKASKIPDKIDQLLTTEEELEDETNTVSVPTVHGTETGNDRLRWDLPEQPSGGQRLQEADKDSDLNIDPEPVRNVVESRTNVYGPSSSILVDQPALRRTLELPQGSRCLIDQYFSHTNSWLPIVERHVVFRTLYSYPMPQSSITRQSPKSGEHAVLWAILACATANISHTDAAEAEAQSPESLAMSELMHATARELIPWENEHNFSVGHVQAMTIIALYHWILHHEQAAALAISHAVSIALLLGLDQLAYQRRPVERVWLGCFVSESLLAMRTGRLPRLRAREVEALLPIDESGPEEWEPWRACIPHSDASVDQSRNCDQPARALSTFNQLTRILCIADGFLQPLLPISMKQRMSLLQAWKKELPQYFMQLDRVTGQHDTAAVLPSSIVNLHTVYLQAPERPHISIPSAFMDDDSTFNSHVAHDEASFAHLGVLLPTGEATGRTGNSTVRQRSNVSTTRGTTYGSLLQLIDETHSGQRLEMPEQMSAALHANLQDSSLATLATDFASAGDTLPSMTDGTSMFDFDSFEPMEDLEIPDDSQFMKGLGYTI
ncbi:hypothetical protein LTR17_027672, partial [Elasticomyces elasticus]